MPIEIKEITIKADVYPQKKQPATNGAVLSPAETERLKKEITREVTQAVLQKLSQTTER